MQRTFPFSAILVVAILVVGCGATPSPAPPSNPALVVDPYQLTFELPTREWTAGEPIFGTARLAVIGTQAVAISGSGTGVLGFEYEEVARTRHVVPAWTADCVPYRLAPGGPLSSRLTKSGGFTAEDPDAAFYQAFFADPVVRLPAGEWRITAVASFTEGEACSGKAVMLKVPITITVTP